ncbi:ABC transporter ATP-binding protein [Candidatus Caldatribacterium sp.]|uniref:ABC transporter ATP-binding protein n=1 Tax=Candidatus Caldatribacterium sp. TaxID=2282143 RepID=UPI0029977729|nr:ABC transporter ATP-binding protein [Candidatus Caldatribacterium sp.]MDW8081594.1 ABC transporter ATP-binding protein [Candidatus Calescibacterium sp.]
MGKYTVILEKVSKVYGDAVKTQVLFDITLAVPEGQFLALIGPSGSGKTTLLNIIGALDRPTRGEVFIEGKRLGDFKEDELARFRNRFLGYVFQFHYLLPEFTALENVLMPHWIAWGKTAKETVERALYLLERVGLKDAARKRITLLSGGQQQRVAIARALMNAPKLLLADEPTGALDTKTGEQVLELLEEIRKEYGTTMIMVTHNRDVALRADRILELVDGRLCKEVYPKEVGHATAAKILEAYECNIENVTPGSPPLEQGGEDVIRHPES